MNKFVSLAQSQKLSAYAVACILKDLKTKLPAKN